MKQKVVKSIACGTIIAAATLIPYNTHAMSQDETVYVKLQETGSLNYVTVNKHLLNDLRDTKLSDRSTLSEIENINGFENYTKDGERIIWDADGKDIYYSGKTDKELPVQLEVEYKLDGETKMAEEMLGKTGKVEIHLKYKNLSKVGNMYTPFVVAMSTMLPEANTHNLTITNGKVISNGSTLMVAAIAAPGLYDSLQLKELENFDEVVLTYETDKFELNDIYNFVTPKFLDEEDLKIFDELDGLYGSMDKLSNSSKELVNGTGALQDGIKELRTAVAEAKKQLASMNNLIDEGILNTIANTAASTARRQIAAQQSKIYAEISSQVRQMAGSLLDTTAMKQEIAASAPVMVEQICAQQVASGIMTAEQCAPMMGQVVNSILTQVGGAIDQKMATIDMGAIANMLAQQVYAQIQNVAAQTASTTARSVATQVADSIQDGMGEKLGGMMDEMLDGIDKLVDGASTLNSGMKRFDQDGIQKLDNTVNGKLRNTSNSLKQLEKLAKQYDNFSGIADGVEGTTKFVLMIEGQKAR